MHGITYIDTLGGLNMDGSTDKNLPYFVVENLATLVAYELFNWLFIHLTTNTKFRLTRIVC